MGLPIIGDVIDAVSDIVSEAVVDVDKKKEIELELAKLRDAALARESAERIGQMEVNKVEANNGSIFVAGWRPFIGWVCGCGLAAQVIALPLLDRIFHWTMPFDTELLLLTMSGMLGIGTMRTVEKIKGVSTNDYRDTPSAPLTYKKEKKGFPKNIIPENVPWMK